MWRDTSEVAPLGDVSFECSMIIFGAHVFGIYLLGGTCVAEIFFGCCNHHCQRRGRARNLIVHTDSNPVCLCNGMHTFQELKKIMKRRDVRFFHWSVRCSSWCKDYFWRLPRVEIPLGAPPIRRWQPDAKTCKDNHFWPRRNKFVRMYLSFSWVVFRWVDRKESKRIEKGRILKLVGTRGANNERGNHRSFAARWVGVAIV